MQLKDTQNQLIDAISDIIGDTDAETGDDGT